MGKDAGRFLVGATAVYLAVAACDATTQTMMSGRDGGAADLLGAARDLRVRDARADQSGGRLKAIYMAGSDGSRQDYGLWDGELQTACGFARAADGSLRCLPARTASAGTYFIDAGCTSTVGVGLHGCAYSFIMAPVGTDACLLDGARYQVFRAGAVIPGGAVYQLSGKDCTKVKLGDSQDAYILGDELPPSAFVDGQLTHD